MHLYRARYIYPVASAPLTDGVVAIENERIVAVGLAADLLPRFPGYPVEDLGDAMLFPQAVNAHTHLDQTAFAALGQPTASQSGFVSWLTHLVTTRKATTLPTMVEGARKGVRLLQESATAAVGDFSNNHISVEPLVESGLYGVVYTLVTGPNPADAERVLHRAREQVQQWRRTYGEERLRFGVALQAPYAVSARLFRLVTDWARQESLPLSVHAAESPAEVEFVQRGSGELLDYLSARYGFTSEWIPPAGCSPVRYLDQLDVLTARPLLIHGIQVTPDDLQILAAHHVAVAHCPRSNALLQCGRMPIESYQQAGVPLALGTDGLSSCPSMSLWEEAGAALRLHQAAGVALDVHALLRLCTFDGARALGLEDRLGSLSPGKLARLALGHPRQAGENSEHLTAEEMLCQLWEGKIDVTAFAPA
jgi:cytosine/adenosine deaminase-related metal-dependent hydrolase